MTDKEIDYNLLEVEKGNKRYGIYLKNHIEDLAKERNKLYKQLQQKEKIIKEVREYIEHENFKRNILVGVSTKKYTRDILNKILEILDKVGNDNERDKDNK